MVTYDLHIFRNPDELLQYLRSEVERLRKRVAELSEIENQVRDFAERTRLIREALVRILGSQQLPSYEVDLGVIKVIPDARPIDEYEVVREVRTNLEQRLKVYSEVLTKLTPLVEKLKELGKELVLYLEIRDGVPVKLLIKELRS